MSVIWGNLLQDIVHTTRHSAHKTCNVKTGWQRAGYWEIYSNDVCCIPEGWVKCSGCTDTTPESTNGYNVDTYGLYTVSYRIQSLYTFAESYMIEQRNLRRWVCELEVWEADWADPPLLKLKSTELTRRFRLSLNDLRSDSVKLVLCERGGPFSKFIPPASATCSRAR